jgi:hypothetical protein
VLDSLAGYFEVTNDGVPRFGIQQKGGSSVLHILQNAASSILDME